jgi:RNA 2',3'-cyclic 3'-phosphodiesterase
MRLFVAIWPPPPVVAALSELEHPDVGTVRWTAPSRWHVTLLFLGQPASPDPEDQIPPAGSVDAAGAVDGAIARLGRIPLEAHAGTVARLGTVTATFGRSVLIVPVLGLDALAGAVRTAYSPGPARSAGPDPAETDPAESNPVAFTGHLTLGRARRRRDDLRPLAGTAVGTAAGMEWAVEELALVASVSRDGKGAYETLSTVSVPGDHYPTSNMRSGLQ